MERGQGRSGDFVNIYGAETRASLELKLGDYLRGERAGLRARDLHQLIGWVAGEDQNVKWVFVKNKPMITQVVLLIVDGLTRAVWERWSAQWERVRTFMQPPPPPKGEAKGEATEEGGNEQPIRLRIPSSLFANDTVMQDYMSYHIKPVKPYGSSTPPPQTPPSTSPPSHPFPVASPPPKRPKTEGTPPPPALHYILTPGQLVENKYPDIKEPGFLHTCDHHRLDEGERSRQVKAALAAGWYCVHTHPWGVEGEEGKGVSPQLEIERLAERMEEDGGQEVKEGEDRMDESRPDPPHVVSTPPLGCRRR